MTTLSEKPKFHPLIEKLAMELQANYLESQRRAISGGEEGAADQLKRERDDARQKLDGSNEHIAALRHLLNEKGVEITTGGPQTAFTDGLTSAAILICRDETTRANYLLANGWKRQIIGQWIDPTSGGTMGTPQAIAKQTERVLKPFGYLLRTLNPHDRT